MKARVGLHGAARLFAALGLAGLVLVSAGPAASGWQAQTEHTVVDGVAEFFGSTCPFGDWVPAVDTVCEDWIAQLFKESYPKQHNRAAWGAFLVRAVSLVRADGTVDTLDEITGLTFDVKSTFDELHLAFASVSASIPMSDGSTRRIDLAWDGSGAAREVAGNNGPYNLNRGLEHHYVGRCFTWNQNAHQTYRANVAVKGTVDGTDVGTIPYQQQFDPFLGRGRFNVVSVTHGACD